MKRLLILLPLVFATNALAHNGRLNSEGCHNDRKEGTYHCHRAASSEEAREFVLAYNQEQPI